MDMIRRQKVSLMTNPLKSRVSTPHWVLSAASGKINGPGFGLIGGLNGWMLSEDFDNQRYAYKVGLEYDGVDRQSGDAVVRELLKELGQFGREHAADLFLRLVSAVARDHLMYGESVFELFNGADGGNSSPRLGVLPGWSLKRRWGHTFQVSSNAGELKWRELPANTLRDFRLPGRLSNELYQSRKRLQALDTFRPEDPDMLAAMRSTGYDFQDHQVLLDEMAAKATKSIGWDGRDSFLRRATNSYRTHRKLAFRRTWLTIVSATNETLNSVFDHPSINEGKTLAIRVTGLPTVEDIERHMAAVTDGTESLDDIFNNVILPRHT
jgi:hypothetical protein